MSECVELLHTANYK